MSWIKKICNQLVCVKERNKTSSILFYLIIASLLSNFFFPYRLKVNDQTKDEINNKWFFEQQKTTKKKMFGNWEKLDWEKLVNNKNSMVIILCMASRLKFVIFNLLAWTKLVLDATDTYSVVEKW